ncbi:hypothetical protein DNTS_016324, partial [Danionella cerebrum]
EGLFQLKLLELPNTGLLSRSSSESGNFSRLGLWHLPCQTQSFPDTRVHPTGMLGGFAQLDLLLDHSCRVVYQRVNESSNWETETKEMPVSVGPYGQVQPSCFDRVKMGFLMGFAVGVAAGSLFGTFSCLRVGMRGRELIGGVGKTMMQSGGTFGTFMAIGMGIRC